jgi:multicomponent Na+:H+ antiporter subunit A
MSAVAFVGGIWLYFRLQRARGLHGRDPSRGPSGQRGFERVMAGLGRLAGVVTRALQHGRLPIYTATLLAAAGLALLPWVLRLELPAASGDVDAGLAAGALLVAGAGLACVFVRRRMALLLASGIAGLGSVLIFLSRGAPDLAFTQLAVDGVFAVVVALALGRLLRPGRNVLPHGRPALALVAAVLAGLGLLLLALGMTAAPFDSALSDYFGAQSLAAAHGRNVVNVIIVDFRGLDTLGEIAVVLLAALAAGGILRRMGRAGR